jgi:uncharacterized protein DUF4159
MMGPVAENPTSMKKWLLKIGSVLPVVLFVLAGFADTGSESTPEFFFTRLIYGNGGGPARTPRLDIRCADLAAGEGGTRYGGGWATDFPASDCKFMWGVERLTGVRVFDKGPHVVAALDPEIFKYPYLYIVEPSRMYLTSEEAKQIREYLDRGGFLHVDDFWGLRQRAVVEEELDKIFPDRKPVKLDLKHEVFHTFFDVDQVMQIPNVSNGCNGGRTWESADETDPMIFGISDDNNRLMVIITYNSDLGDAWEWMDNPCYPEMYSGQAYRMGINFILYAMSH